MLEKSILFFQLSLAGIWARAATYQRILCIVYDAWTAMLNVFIFLVLAAEDTHTDRHYFRM